MPVGLLPFIMASCIAFVLGGCGAAPPTEGKSAKRVPLVKVDTVLQGALTRWLELTGETVQVETVQISSMVDGPIGYCPWREGDQVAAGEQLVTIDRELYRAEVKATEAALDVAEAKLADMRAGTRPEELDKAEHNIREAEEQAGFTRTDLERINQLVTSGALPGEEAEKAQVAHVAAETQMQNARRQFEMLTAGHTRTEIGVQEAVVREAAARLELAQARLAECLIPAPFAGVVTKVFMRTGDLAAVKTPLLELAAPESLVLRGAAPEAQAAMLEVGMSAQVRLDAFPDKVFQAEVARVFPELDARFRTRTVELKLAESPGLLAGMFGRVRLALETVADAVSVPVQAMITTPAGATVAFVAVEGKAVQRNVQTGFEAAGRIQIRSGLEAGETVIVAGHEKLRDGAEIRLPQPPPAEGGKQGTTKEGAGKKEAGQSGQGGGA